MVAYHSEPPAASRVRALCPPLVMSRDERCPSAPTAAPHFTPRHRLTSPRPRAGCHNATSNPPHPLSPPACTARHHDATQVTVSKLYDAAAEDATLVAAARWMSTTPLLADTPPEQRTVARALASISACVVLSRPRPRPVRRSVGVSSLAGTETHHEDAARSSATAARERSTPHRSRRTRTAPPSCNTRKREALMAATDTPAAAAFWGGDRRSRGDRRARRPRRRRAARR